MAARHEVFYDTEAALRLVDHELSEHRSPNDSPAAPTSSPATTPATSLPALLERVTAEIQIVLASLRDSRDALETATVEQIQRTSEKLREVTSATEDATTAILDALDRAQALVDDLDAADETGDRDGARATRGRLREEIFGMVGSLQFQDITTQQLAYAGSVLTDMEDRLLALAQLFDPAAAFARTSVGAPDARSFDAHATLAQPEQRQALADAIFRLAR